MAGRGAIPVIRDHRTSDLVPPFADPHRRVHKPPTFPVSKSAIQGANVPAHLLAAILTLAVPMLARLSALPASRQEIWVPRVLMRNIPHKVIDRHKTAAVLECFADVGILDALGCETEARDQ